MSGLSEKLREVLRTDSPLWRRALHVGVHYGPDAWVRYSPPLFGMAFGAALKKPREVVRATLERIRGPRPAHVELAEVAEVFAAFASSMTDAMLCGAGRGYQPLGRPVGDWHFLSSVARGRGVILATAQTAGWDVGGPALSQLHRREVLVAMAAEHDDRARDLHDASRRRAGVHVVHVGADPLGALPLLRHLKNGGVVALKMDRVTPGMRTRPVRFLGAGWRVPEGPLALAAISGAPIVPVFTRRLGFLEYEAHNTAPIRLPRRPTEPELDTAAQSLAERLEAFVRAHPTQWFRFEDEPPFTD